MRNIFLTSGIIAVLVSVFSFLALGYIKGDFENKKIASVEMSDDYKIVAGVIRNNGDGWSLIQDNSHETIGITSVEQTEDKIVVKYNKNSKVNSASVTVDETMESEGYSVGASVGDAEMWIQVFNKKGKLINPADYQNKTGNIWIMGFFKK